MPTYYDTSITSDQFGSSVGDVIYGWPSNGSSTYDPIKYDYEFLYGWAKGDNETSPSGNDKLYGGTGNDELYGGTGNDILYGGKNNDWLYGHSGDDKLYEGSGDNNLYGGSGNDIFYDGSGEDIFYDGISYNSVYGGNGNDIFYGNSGYDDWVGEAGRDTFVLGDKGQVYYDQGQGSDYAVIRDFDKQNDSIQLYGSKDNYRLETSVSTGSYIYYEQPGADERIAWFSSVTDLNLGGSYFDFVT